MNTPFVVTIDGPSGCGKSTISQKIAQQFDCRLLDSGALYRLVAWLVDQDHDNQQDLLLSLTLDDIQFVPGSDGKPATVLYQQQDCTDALRHPDMSQKASIIAADATVRQALVAAQRGFFNQRTLIAEGRDMGTTIFPDARYKFYLTADLEERVQRRAKQLLSSNRTVNIDALRNGIIARDERDANRANSPLQPAKDAIIIDTTDLTFQQAMDMIMNHIHETNEPRRHV